MLTGAGIGGEYAAINSAIQELIPARYRGRTDLAINGSFWVGAALGAFGAVVLLQPGLLPPDWGWRAAFGIGAVLGLAHPGAAPVDPGEPALADAARPPRRMRRGASPGSSAASCGTAEIERLREACRPHPASPPDGARSVVRMIRRDPARLSRGARCSAWC